MMRGWFNCEIELSVWKGSEGFAAALFGESVQVWLFAELQFAVYCT